MDSTPAAWAVEGPGRRIRAQLQRLGQHPGGTWSLSWVLLFAGGIWLEPMGGWIPGIVSCVLAALFAGLTWVGALAFAGRHAPLWILPAAFAMGLTRAVVWVLAGPAAGDAVALLYEPAAVLAGAFIVWRADLLEDDLGLRLALTLSLFAVAILEVADGLTPALASVPEPMVAWLVVAPFAAFFELRAMWAWIARRELRIEHAEDGQRMLEDEVARERRINALLRRKEAWLFDFFEKAPDMLLVLAPGSCEILRCNRRFSETLGLARRDLVGRSLIDFVAPETIDQVRPILEARRRRVRNLLLHLHRHDDSELVVLANLAMRGEADGAEAVRAVLHDVTRLERPGALGDLHRVVTDHSAAGIFHADDKGRCALVNASYCELTGVTLELAHERSWLASVHPDDRRRVEDAWDRAVAEGAAFRAEHRLQNPSGPAVRVLTECIPVDEGVVGGFAGSMTRLSNAGAPASMEAARRKRGAARGEDAPRR